MTQPDREVRTVYKAIADFSELLREAAVARAEMQALKRDVDAAAANVKVKVTADTTGVRAEIVRAVAGIVAKVKVTVDAVAAKAEVDRVFKGLTATVKVTLSAVAVQTEMRALIRRLERMGPVRLNVTIDPGVFARVAALQAALTALRVPPLGGGGGGAAGLPGAAGAAGGGGGLRGKLIMAAVALSPILIPTITSATAAVGTLTAGMLAAGAATAVFGIAAVGHVKKLTEAIKENNKSGAPLTGAIAEIAPHIEALRQEYQQFQKDTEKPVFSVLTGGLHVVSGLLPRLVRLVDAASVGIRAGMAAIDEALNSAGFDRFLDFVADKGPGAIASFTRILVKFGAGIADLVMAFGPFVGVFLDGLEAMAARFAEWARGLGATDGFKKFMAYAIQQGPIVLSTIAAIVGAFINLGKVLAPLGDVLLLSVRALAEFVAWLNPAAVTTFTEVLLLAVVAWKAYNAVIALSLGLTGLAGFRAGLAALLPRMALYIGVVRGAAIATWGWVASLTALQTATLIGAVLSVIALVAALFAYNSSTTDAVNNTEDLARANKELTDVYREQGKAAGDAAFRRKIADDPVLAKSIEAYLKLGGSIRDYQDALNGDEAAAKRVSDVFNTQLAKLKDLAVQFDAGKISVDQYDAGIRGLGLDPGKVDEYTRGLLDARDGFEQGAASGRLAAKQLAEFDAAARNATGAVKSLAEQLRAANEETPDQTRMGKAIAVLDAFKTATDAVTASRVREGEVAAQAAEANEQATRQVAQSAKALVRAHDGVRAAQEALTQARVDAADKLEDLRRRERDIPLTEEAARIALDQARAQERAGRADPNATRLDRRQNRLNTVEAENALNDLLADNVKLREDIDEAQRNGVEGSAEVVDAKKNLQDAIDAERDAEDNLTEAKKNRIKVEIDGTKATGEAAAATADLEAKAAAAKAALDLEAAALGLTVPQLQAYRDTLTGLDHDLTINLKGDLEEKLRTALTYMKAMDFLAAAAAAGKPISMEEALAMARASLPAPPKTEAQKQRDFKRRTGEAFAEGGPVYGPGTGTSDSIRTTIRGTDQPARIAAGEHILTALEVVRAGGHAVVERIRAAIRGGRLGNPDHFRYAFGGPVLPAQRMALTPRFAGVPVPSYAGGGAVQAFRAGGAVTNNAGLHIGQVTVNNPRPEKAGDSLYRAVRKLADEYDG